MHEPLVDLVKLKNRVEAIKYLADSRIGLPITSTLMDNIERYVRLNISPLKKQPY